MLYELIAVVRPGKLNEVREIAKTVGSLVLSRTGVIRGLTNWGTFLLPKPRSLHGTKHHTGHYFIMRFDASAGTQHAVRKTLALDPRMIRFSVVKMGSTLQQIKSVQGFAGFGEEEMEGAAKEKGFVGEDESTSSPSIF